MAVWCLIVGLLAIFVSNTEARFGPIPKELQKPNYCMKINDDKSPVIRKFDLVDIHSKEAQEVLHEGVKYLNDVMQKIYVCSYIGLPTRVLRQSLIGATTYCVKFWAFDKICTDPSLSSMCNMMLYAPTPLWCDLKFTRLVTAKPKDEIELHCSYAPGD